MTRELGFNPHWAYLFHQTDGDRVEQRGRGWISMSVGRKITGKVSETETTDSYSLQTPSCTRETLI